VSVECEYGCNITCEEIKVYDHEGNEVATGHLTVFEDTINYADIFVTVPYGTPPGTYTWKAVYPGTAVHAGGEVDFSITVLPVEYYRLTIRSEPFKGVPVTINTLEVGVTDVEVEVSPGTYTVTMPDTWEDVPFSHWEDESTNPVRTIDVTEDMEIIAYYEKPPWPWYYYALLICGIALIAYALVKRRR